MIVFNGDAILVLIIGIILCLPIGGLFYFDVIDDGTAVLCGSWTLFVGALIGGLLDLRGRFFWIIPTWIAALGFAIYVSYEEWDTFKSIIIFIGSVLVLIISLILFFIQRNEKKRISEIENGQVILPLESNEDYWEDIKNLFFYPTFKKNTTKIYSYNIKVLDTLKDNGIELEGHDQFRQELEKTKNLISRGEKASPDSEIKELYMNQIDLKIEAQEV